MVRQTRIDDNGDIQLPPELRTRLGWRAGDQLIIEELGDSMLLRPAESSRDAVALGEAGRTLAGEVLPPEDFSDWENNGG